MRKSLGSKRKELSDTHIEHITRLFGSFQEARDEDGKPKLMESEVLAEQARNNSKAQFAASPNLDTELMNAIIEAFEAHQIMSKQALDSDQVRAGMKSILLGPAGLYEGLRDGLGV